MLRMQAHGFALSLRSALNQGERDSCVDPSIQLSRIAPDARACMRSTVQKLEQHTPYCTHIHIRCVLATCASAIPAQA